jgi:hypothetical protein
MILSRKNEFVQIISQKKVSKKFDSFPELSYLCETNGGER